MELGLKMGAVWQYFVLGLTLLLSLLAAGHAIVYKRDSRSAVLWAGLVLLLPLVGAVLYFLLGVNRIKRRAVALRGQLEHYQSGSEGESWSVDRLAQALPPGAAHLIPLVRTVDRVVQRPLVPGNRVTPYVNGDEAFPAMLEAIDRARESIALVTYIFDRDRAGRRFVEALGRAVTRGVAVRVLVDDTGARYSFPSIVQALRRVKVPVARFLPTRVPWRLMTVNLRNHRKIMVVDGETGFTGGINIREGNLLREAPRYPVQDLQFRVDGPVVAHLQESFVDDWRFTTGEALRDAPWFRPLELQGPVLARGISDGPDEDFEKLRWTILGALAAARDSIRVLTPYFVPEPSLISALSVAALRGVEVDIVLPARNNLPFMHWAASALLWQVLERGCRVWMTPPPFDHSKLLVVDGAWSLIGSANWDARSLRLNFEFNLECYGESLAAALEALVQSKIRQARSVSLADVDGRPLPIKLRDGIARLLTPYL